MSISAKKLAHNLAKEHLPNSPDRVKGKYGPSRVLIREVTLRKLSDKLSIGPTYFQMFTEYMLELGWAVMKLEGSTIGLIKVSSTVSWKKLSMKSLGMQGEENEG
jgi:hypothetical protein